MIQEFDRVVLTTDIQQYGLKSGDIGTVVLVYQHDTGYEVEFMALDGETLAVVTLDEKMVRLAKPGEMSHARMFEETVEQRI